MEGVESLTLRVGRTKTGLSEQRAKLPRKSRPPSRFQCSHQLKLLSKQRMAEVLAFLLMSRCEPGGHLVGYVVKNPK